MARFLTHLAFVMAKAIIQNLCFNKALRARRYVPVPCEYETCLKLWNFKIFLPATTSVLQVLVYFVNFPSTISEWRSTGHTKNYMATARLHSFKITSKKRVIPQKILKNLQLQLYNHPKYIIHQ